MLAQLIRKEILDHLLSLRFLILTAIGAIAIWMSLLDGASYYSARLNDYRTGENATAERMEDLIQSDWLELGNIGFEKHKPPSPLSIFVRGLEPVQGRSISNSYAAQQRLRKSPAEDDPLLGVFPPLDLGLVVQAVLGLFALLLTYDAISGEKEAGTLRLTGSFAVARYKMIAGKLIGALIPILAVFGLPLLIGTAAVTLLPEVQFTGADWTRLSVIFGLFAVYLAAFVCAGLLGSALTSRPATSFVLLLCFWTASVVVIPRLAFIVANRIRPAPSIHEHHARKFNIESEHFAEWQRVRAKWVEEYTAREGRSPGATPEGAIAYRRLHIKSRDDYYGKLHPLIHRLNEEFRNRDQARLNLAKTLGRLSPGFAFKNGVIRLSGTGISNHKRFEDAFIQYYEKQYRPWVLDLADRISFQYADPATYGEPEWDITTMPEFTYTAPGPGEALQAGFVEIGWLALWGLVFFAAATVRILRYDLR